MEHDEYEEQKERLENEIRRKMDEPKKKGRRISALAHSISIANMLKDIPEQFRDDAKLPEEERELRRQLSIMYLQGMGEGLGMVSVISDTESTDASEEVEKSGVRAITPPSTISTSPMYSPSSIASPSPRRAASPNMRSAPILASAVAAKPAIASPPALSNTPPSLPSVPVAQNSADGSLHSPRPALRRSSSSRAVHPNEVTLYRYPGERLGVKLSSTMELEGADPRSPAAKAGLGATSRFMGMICTHLNGLPLETPDVDSAAEHSVAVTLRFKEAPPPEAPSPEEVPVEPAPVVKKKLKRKTVRRPLNSVGSPSVSPPASRRSSVNMSEDEMLEFANRQMSAMAMQFRRGSYLTHQGSGLSTSVRAAVQSSAQRWRSKLNSSQLLETAKAKAAELERIEARHKDALRSLRHRVVHAIKRIEETSNIQWGKLSNQEAVELRTERADLLQLFANADSEEQRLIDDFEAEKKRVEMTEDERTIYRLHMYTLKEGTPEDDDRKKRAFEARQKEGRTRIAMRVAVEQSLETSARAKLKARERAQQEKDKFEGDKKAAIAMLENEALSLQRELSSGSKLSTRSKDRLFEIRHILLPKAKEELEAYLASWEDNVPQLTQAEERAMRGVEARKKQLLEQRDHQRDRALRVLKAKREYSRVRIDTQDTEERRSLLKAKLELGRQFSLHWKVAVRRQEAERRAYERASIELEKALNILDSFGDPTERLQLLAVGVRLKQNQAALEDEAGRVKEQHRHDEELAELDPNDRVLERTMKAEYAEQLKKRRIVEHDMGVLEAAEALASADIAPKPLSPRISRRQSWFERPSVEFPKTMLSARFVGQLRGELESAYERIGKRTEGYHVPEEVIVLPAKESAEGLDFAAACWYSWDAPGGDTWVLAGEVAKLAAQAASRLTCATIGPVVTVLAAAIASQTNRKPIKPVLKKSPSPVTSTPPPDDDELGDDEPVHVTSVFSSPCTPPLDDDPPALSRATLPPLNTSLTAVLPVPDTPSPQRPGVPERFFHHTHEPLPKDVVSKRGASNSNSKRRFTIATAKSRGEGRRGSVESIGALERKHSSGRRHTLAGILSQRRSSLLERSASNITSDEDRGMVRTPSVTTEVEQRAPAPWNRTPIERRESVRRLNREQRKLSVKHDDLLREIKAARLRVNNF